MNNILFDADSNNIVLCNECNYEFKYVNLKCYGYDWYAVCPICECYIDVKVDDIYNDYLHGRCDEYALKKYQDGDIFIIVTEYDEDINRICLMHCFLKREDKYIDARGILNTINDVLDEFNINDDDINRYDEYDIYKCDSINEFKKLYKYLGWKHLKFNKIL